VVVSGGRAKVQSKGRRVGKTSAQKARRQTPGRPHALVSAHERPTCAHRDAHALCCPPPDVLFPPLLHWPSYASHCGELAGG
ncbi:hypothetical protein BV22DRAFT_1041300, partial [Leucogyrophana mollusca]